MELPYPQGDNP